MYSNHYKIMTSISVVFIVLLALLLPAIFSISVFVILVTINTLLYFHQNYDIDYKYGFSFIGQLLGLIFIVGSIIAIFSLVVSLGQLY